MKNKNQIVIAEGEVIKINNEFYLGKRMDNRIEETENIEEIIKDKLEIGKKVKIILEKS